jgi:ribonuclease HI
VVSWNDEARLPYWRTHGWRKRSGGAVKNVQHWQRLIAAAERHHGFALHWLRGHAGHQWNERADQLAGMARQLALQPERAQVLGAVHTQVVA